MRTSKIVGPALIQQRLPDEIAGMAPELEAVFADAAVEVVAARLDVPAYAARSLVRLLSASERARAARFIRNRDRRRFIVARARLRQLLAARLGTQPESVEFTYGAHGKPALAADLAAFGLRFNVSHAQDLALYAITYGREVGVDVEAVRALSDADDIAARFFSRHENEAYRALELRDRPRGFFNCWTRKEAFIKAIGEGLSHPLDRFDVTLAPGEQARILRVAEAPGETCGWALRSFSPAPGFVAALVVRDGVGAPAARADQQSRATA